MNSFVNVSDSLKGPLDGIELKSSVVGCSDLDHVKIRINISREALAKSLHFGHSRQ